MIQLSVSKEDLRVFRLCQIKERPDWWAVFSTNEYDQVWPYTTRGITTCIDRVELMNRVPKICEIARIFRQSRPGGGRFFINQYGAYYHQDENGPYERFIEFSPQPFVQTVKFVKKG